MLGRATRKKYSLSVIVPAYNEEQNVESLLRSTISFLEKNTLDYEIIFIDDCSVDDTLSIAKKMSIRNNKIKVFSNDVNLGFGLTGKRGLSLATMDLVTLVPCDNQFDVNELRVYLDYIDDYDIIVGYRIKRMDSLMRRFIAKVYTLVIALLFQTTWFGDIDWVKMYRRSIFNNINIVSSTAFVDAEILIKAHKLGYRIKEVGVHHYPRRFGRQSGGDIKVLYRAIKNLIFYRIYYHNKNETKSSFKN